MNSNGSNALSAETQSELREFNAQYATAFSAGDAPALAQLFAEGASVMNSAGDILVGRNAIETALARAFTGPCRHAALEISPRFARHLSPEMVLEHGTTRTILAQGVSKHSGDLDYTKVFIRHDGRWHLLAAHFAKRDGI